MAEQTDDLTLADQFQQRQIRLRGVLVSHLENMLEINHQYDGCNGPGLQKEIRWFHQRVRWLRLAPRHQRESKAFALQIWELCWQSYQAELTNSEKFRTAFDELFVQAFEDGADVAFEYTQEIISTQELLSTSSDALVSEMTNWRRECIDAFQYRSAGLVSHAIRFLHWFRRRRRAVQAHEYLVINKAQVETETNICKHSKLECKNLHKIEMNHGARLACCSEAIIAHAKLRSYLCDICIGCFKSGGVVLDCYVSAQVPPQRNAWFSNESSDFDPPVNMMHRFVKAAVECYPALRIKGKKSLHQIKQQLHASKCQLLCLRARVHHLEAGSTDTAHEAMLETSRLQQVLERNCELCRKKADKYHKAGLHGAADCYAAQNKELQRWTAPKEGLAMVGRETDIGWTTARALQEFSGEMKNIDNPVEGNVLGDDAEPLSPESDKSTSVLSPSSDSADASLEGNFCQQVQLSACSLMPVEWFEESYAHEYSAESALSVFPQEVEAQLLLLLQAVPRNDDGSMNAEAVVASQCLRESVINSRQCAQQRQQEQHRTVKHLESLCRVEQIVRMKLSDRWEPSGGGKGDWVHAEGVETAEAMQVEAGQVLRSWAMQNFHELEPQWQIAGLIELYLAILLAHDFHKVRAMTCLVLGQMGSFVVAERLRAALHDKEWMVRQCAVMAVAAVTLQKNFFHDTVNPQLKNPELVAVLSSRAVADLVDILRTEAISKVHDLLPCC